jgi:hypothetical protein
MKRCLGNLEIYLRYYHKHFVRLKRNSDRRWEEELKVKLDKLIELQ